MSWTMRLCDDAIPAITLFLFRSSLFTVKYTNFGRRGDAKPLFARDIYSEYARVISYVPLFLRDPSSLGEEHAEKNKIFIVWLNSIPNILTLPTVAQITIHASVSKSKECTRTHLADQQTSRKEISISWYVSSFLRSFPTQKSGIAASHKKLFWIFSMQHFYLIIYIKYYINLFFTVLYRCALLSHYQSAVKVGRITCIDEH